MDYLPPARAVFLTGFMGTGKTTTGLHLSGQLGLEFVDTDDIVEAMAGRAISAIFAEEGEEAFRDLETQALRQAVRGPRRVIATGGGMMLRPQNVALMRAAGPVICLEATPATILRRTAHKGTRPLLAGPDPLAAINRLLGERRVAYAQADYTVCADGDDRRAALRRIMRVLAHDPRTALLTRDSARVQVRVEGHEYGIHIERGAFGKLGALCPAPEAGVRCAVITTDVIGPLYGERVLDTLRAGGWDAALVTVADGEGAKTLRTAEQLYDRLVDLRVDGAGAVFALGGGMVGDLSGFVAATYRRGIRFAQLPTSLLAQVDAASGGKVAVNHPRAKNLVGAFHQPAAVVIDSATLETLPERELTNGLAEVIKHALIADAALFEFLEADVGAFMGLEEVAVRYVLARNCRIKADVVMQDPYDRGLRACLNYGHTIGHAVEQGAGEWALRHGEAVAVGMVAEARLAHALGRGEEAVVRRLVALLERVGLPTSAPGLDVDKALRALEVDKKIAAGRLRLPVVPSIGRVTVLPDVEVGALREAVQSVAGGG